MISPKRRCDKLKFIYFIIIPIESNMSKRTAASGASFKKRVAAEKKEQGENAEWDRSTVASEKK